MFRKRLAGLQDEMAQAFLFLKTGFHFFGERLPEAGKGEGLVLDAIDGAVELGVAHADDEQFTGADFPLHGRGRRAYPDCGEPA